MIKQVLKIKYCESLFEQLRFGFSWIVKVIEHLT